MKIKNIIIPEEFSTLESIVCDLNMENLKYRFILCYRSPTSTTEHNDLFLQHLNILCDTSMIVILLGDFNFPEIKWKKNQTLIENSLSSKFFELSNELGLHQFVHQPTLGLNILDLIFCSMKLFIYGIKNSPPFSTSDHDSIYFNIQTPTENIENQSLTRDFEKADYPSILHYLSTICWPIKFNTCLNTDDFYNIFCEIINTAIENHVPFRKLPTSSKKFPRNILNLQKIKLFMAKK